MSMTLPTTMPSPAAMEMSHPSAVAGRCACGPSVVSTDLPPAPTSQTMRRSRAIPAAMMSASARPIDFHNTARNRGDSIWFSALTASSSMAGAQT